MAGAKTTILINPHTGAEHEFEAGHAARIMARQDSGGWTYKEALAEPEATGTTKKGKNAATSRSTAGKAGTATQPDEDCGCH